MNKSIGLSYGIMADPIKKQLKDQGFKFIDGKVEQFQKELEAIHTLRFGNNLLTDSMADKMFERLHKAVVNHVKVQNKLKEVKK